MTKTLLVSVLLFCASASAADIYDCSYAKASFANGKMGPLSASTPAKVEFLGSAIKVHRPGGSFLISPPLNQDKGEVLMADDGSKVYASAKNKTSFAVSDKVSRTTEQWDRCEIAASEKAKSQVKEDMKRIADIPWGGQEANRFFMKETHLFMMLDCGWAGSVGFSTGRKPLVMLGNSYYPSDKAAFKNGEYSITFNGGSMSVAYNPQKVKGYISDSHSFTPCAAVRLGED